MKRLLALAWVTLVALVASCSAAPSDGLQTPTGDVAIAPATEPTPSSASAVAGFASSPPAVTPTDTPEQVAQGQTVFGRVCASCHDESRRTYSFVRKLESVKYPGSAIRDKIRRRPGPQGDSPVMPSIGTDQLPDAELPALFAYLRSIDAITR